MSGVEPSRHPPDRGAITMVVLMALALVAVSVVAAGRLTVELTDLTRAQLAADAAALAGVGGGPAQAGEAARRNGARLVAFTQLGDDVVVRVVVASAEASARAGP